LLVGSSIAASFSAITRYVDTICSSRAPALGAFRKRTLEPRRELVVHHQKLLAGPKTDEAIAEHIWGPTANSCARGDPNGFPFVSDIARHLGRFWECKQNRAAGYASPRGICQRSVAFRGRCLKKKAPQRTALNTVRQGLIRTPQEGVT
jgi:hypothetical protein